LSDWKEQPGPPITGRQPAPAHAPPGSGSLPELLIDQTQPLEVFHSKSGGFHAIAGSLRRLGVIEPVATRRVQSRLYQTAGSGRNGSIDNVTRRSRLGTFFSAANSVSVLSLVAVLAGCQTLPHDGTAPEIGAGHSEEPVLAAIASATPGANVVLPEPEKQIRVVRAYYSAAGHTCKEFTATALGQNEVLRLACESSTGWRMVPAIAGTGRF
jgi:hypothetical protein